MWRSVIAGCGPVVWMSLTARYPPLISNRGPRFTTVHEGFSLQAVCKAYGQMSRTVGMNEPSVAHIRCRSRGPEVLRC